MPTPVIFHLAATSTVAIKNTISTQNLEMSRHRPFVAAWVYSANSWFLPALVRTASRDLRFSALTGNNHHVPTNPSHPSNYNAVAVKLFCFFLNRARNNMKETIGCDVHEFSIPASSRCSVEVHHTLPSVRYTVPLHFACVRGLLLQHESSKTTYFFSPSLAYYHSLKSLQQ